MSIYTPKELPVIAEKTGIDKANYSWKKTLTLGMLAGAYIAMGATLAVFVGYGFPGISEQNPVFPKLLSGLMFPVGLMLVIIAGAELFTGNNAMLIPGFMNGKIKWHTVLKNWALVFGSNFIGTIFFAYLLVHITGILSHAPWQESIIHTAVLKTTQPWHVIFLKGIGANWLVCLAVWLGLTAHTTTGKIAGIWWPLMAFVVLGYEHSIANMFYVPMGIFEGAPVTWSAFFFNNLIPSALGNIVGGAVFVGGMYWYTYIKLEKKD